ncbi:MAG: HWE histidine kinase domain-containing protein [Alphaproteobacteria bacterium]|nr:HWE histidine kinase domain-containing protein [Alphaproteobacteria bacterium]
MNDLNASPDLTMCDREPITLLERIQSFGFLLLLSDEWKILRSSANLSQFLNISHEDSIGLQFDQIVTRNAQHDIRNQIAILQLTGVTERLYGLPLLTGGPRFDIALHQLGDMLVLEAELSGLDDRVDAASLVRGMTVQLSKQETLEAFHKHTVRQVRAITAFDRVMIYRFDENGAGEVIAEDLTPGMEEFFGLHYPATDIPVQARALYLRNPFRIVADVTAETVPLWPPASDAIAPLDLSQAITRAVSPVHLEYLSNMGVGASLSISIIVNGQLWGLIACHNNSPRLPSFVVRTAAELFGQMYSMMLESRLQKQNASIDQDAHEKMDYLANTLAQNNTLLTDVEWLQKSLREIIKCDGIAIFIGGNLALSGSTPSRDEVKALCDYQSTMSVTRIFTTNNLSALFPEASAYADRAAGLLSIPFSRTPRDYIILFRRERVHEVNWAGDPKKSVSINEDGMRLSPRKSFAAFLETIRGQSLPFTEQERRAADVIRSSLIDVILYLSDVADEDRKRNEQHHEMLIAELNHRVRNILALIRGLINQSRPKNGETQLYIESLNSRVQSLARAHDQVTQFNDGPYLLSSLVQNEMAAHASVTQECYTFEGQDVLLLSLSFTTLALVIHELVTNSVKYGALSGNGRVTLEVEYKNGEGAYLKWIERGGPPVKTPKRCGFGSTVVQRSIPYDLQGTAEVRYNVEGLEADFFVPDQHISGPNLQTVREVSSSNETRQRAKYSESQHPLQNVNVLLLEDNMIVALEASEILRELGAEFVWTVSTLGAAENIVKNEKVGFAMLDINLGTENSLELAEECQKQGIPFIFASGYGSDGHMAGVRKSALTVKKPYTIDTLRSAIAETLDGG